MPKEMGRSFGIGEGGDG
jgi:hypothetical protein